jgi:hypothetical protein
MYKSLTQVEGGMPLKAWLTAIAAVRPASIAQLGLKGWLGVSMTLSTLIVATSIASTGDFLGGYTDHLHHARAAWTVFHVGWEIYMRPFGEVGIEVPYPQAGLFWPQWPVPYPPGMFAVFAPMAIVGRYIPMSGIVYGKVIILYLVLITHAALWVIGTLLRRPESPYGTLPLAMLWLFSVRLALMGFYDGAWLLPGAIAVAQMTKGRSAAALLWFTAAALVSYRGAAFLPMALLALWRFLAQEYPRTRRLAVLGLCGVGCTLIVATFWALNKYAPQSAELRQGVDSPLLKMSPRSYFVILLGVVFPVLLARFEGLTVGTAAAVAAVLSFLHAGHSWHGTLCIPMLMSSALSNRNTWRGTIFAVLFVALIWQFAFYFSPFQFFEELLRFCSLRGAPK